MTDSYYSKTLSADRLVRCYELAPPRVQTYLKAEIQHIRERIKPGTQILELGCGYGRVLKDLSEIDADMLFGVDISLSSLRLACEYLAEIPNTALSLMNAVELGFNHDSFDMVFFIQNGISAFNVDQRKLLEAAIAVTTSGGTILFSTYSEAFWGDRLDWFRIQADHRLIGEIDESQTGNGVIICKDGFRATTLKPEEILDLARGLGSQVSVETVDNSSIFCEIRN